MSPRRMGVGDITVTVPVTLSCGMKLMPVMSPMVLSTVRISTLSKFTETISSAMPGRSDGMVCGGTTVTSGGRGCGLRLRLRRGREHVHRLGFLHRGLRGEFDRADDLVRSTIVASRRPGIVRSL